MINTKLYICLLSNTRRYVKRKNGTEVVHPSRKQTQSQDKTAERKNTGNKAILKKKDNGQDKVKPYQLERKEKYAEPIGTQENS